MRAPVDDVDEALGGIIDVEQGLDGFSAMASRVSPSILMLATFLPAVVFTTLSMWNADRADGA